ncbi:hypothetical protein JHK85_051286 [Glycine max]|nr:hypothetical protein JHK85_051286 [Glycine max]
MDKTDVETAAAQKKKSVPPTPKSLVVSSPVDHSDSRSHNVSNTRLINEEIVEIETLDEDPEARDEEIVDEVRKQWKPKQVKQSVANVEFKKEEVDDRWSNAVGNDNNVKVKTSMDIASTSAETPSPVAEDIRNKDVEAVVEKWIEQQPHQYQGHCKHVNPFFDLDFSSKCISED